MSLGPGLDQVRIFGWFVVRHYISCLWIFHVWWFCQSTYGVGDELAYSIGGLRNTGLSADSTSLSDMIRSFLAGQL